jgi:hypothetical protein
MPLYLTDQAKSFLAPGALQPVVVDPGMFIPDPGSQIPDPNFSILDLESWIQGQVSV